MIASLTAEKLACARGDRTLFEGLSFRVSAGQALAVEGANGAGKTSLLRHLVAGFLAPRAGRLVPRSTAMKATTAKSRSKVIGWFVHHDGLKPQLTVIEQLGFFADSIAAPPIVARRWPKWAWRGKKISLPLSLGRPEAPAGAGAADAEQTSALGAGRTFRRFGPRRSGADRAPDGAALRPGRHHHRRNP